MSIVKLIDDLVAQAREIPTSTLVQRALTMGGCIPEEDKFAPLSLAERYAIECIVNKSQSLTSDGQISLAFRPHGKLHVLPREEFEIQSDFFTLIGHVELSEAELVTYLEKRQSAQSALEEERPAILNYLFLHGFECVCGQLSSLSEHMAPLIYYVDEVCISNFYNVGKSDFKLEITLENALKNVCDQRENSPIELLTAVYCLHLLLLSGSHTRFEELNSSQLSGPVLASYFDDKYAIYQKAGGAHSDVESHSLFFSSFLEDKAVLLAHMRRSIESTSRFIRHINGVNLRKKENILPILPVQVNASIQSLHRSAHTMAMLQRWMGPNRSAQKTFLPSSFGDLLKEIELVLAQKTSFPSGLESLIDYVVSEAVCSTRSDFGMTRGARDFLKYSTALSKEQTEVVSSWGLGEYFCHVVPSEEIKSVYSPKTLSVILNAISGRMRYNSWHYAPSHFEISKVPADRSWFYAPGMADITDWSDQHHAGHIHASVRYCIRSPLPICVRDYVFPGLIDLRLMRQSGDPYSREDLVTAIAYTEALQFIYQSLMNFVLKENKSFAFTFGDKKWIEKACSPQAPEMVAEIA